MLIDDEVLITLNPKNISLYKSMGYEIPDKPKNSKIIVKVSDLSRGSKVLVYAKCDYCTVIKKVSYKEYNRNISFNNKFSCSNKCGSIKKKELSIVKYGVESPSMLDDIKNKSKITNLVKYGVEYYMNTQDFKNKKKNSILKKYGVDSYSKTNEYKVKVKNTNLERYGVEHYAKTYYAKERIRHTNLEKYDVDNYSKTEEYKEKTKIGNDIFYIKYLGNNISLFKCNKSHNFEIHIDNYHGRKSKDIELCTICNPIGSQKSFKEKDLLEFIQNNYQGEIISSYRDGLEIDIYLPELNLGFEFNGLYWHSNKFKEKNYHLHKTNYFKDNGIRIIHIWEDDWVFRRKIVESQILNLIIKSSEKIFARKCVVKLVDVKETRKFLDDNHIQGFVNSKLKLGLYYNNELVSIMTFDQFEGRKKMEEGGYNLSRFCNKINTNVVGGASKLLNHFIKNYNPSRIISYANKDWSVGNLYYLLGFENVGGNGPDYKYIVDGKRVHKSNYKKSKLDIRGKSITESDQMKINGVNKIYDCGKIKFEKLI